MKKPAAQRNIHRMDSESSNTHAWSVQIRRRDRVASKMFSDALWGGKVKALEAAKAWRDEQIERLDEPLAGYETAMWRRNLVRRNNKSGIVGVARYERKPKPGVKVTGAAYWLAFWNDEHGASRKRKFSVKRWGERGAQELAIEEREKRVREATAATTGLARKA